MGQQDIYHDTVKRALQKENWTITRDPFPLKIGEKHLLADLGAERLIDAEQGLRKIVVETKSFLGHSEVRDLQQAIGQYIMYRRVLDRTSSDYLLYLAVTEVAYETVFEIELGQIFLVDNFVRLIVFDDQTFSFPKRKSLIKKKRRGIFSYRIALTTKVQLSDSRTSTAAICGRCPTNRKPKLAFESFASLKDKLREGFAD